MSLHFEFHHHRTPKGGRTTDLKFDPEDLIALGAVIVAILMTAGMVFGSVPINKLTVGVAGFSGSGGIIIGIIKARGGGGTGKLWAALAILAFAFAAYVWATWDWVATKL
jgi:hypothetical protein